MNTSLRPRLVVDSAGDPELQSWSTTFQFETDQKRLNSIREVKARLKPLEDKTDRFKAAHHVRVYPSSMQTCLSRHYSCRPFCSSITIDM